MTVWRRAVLDMVPIIFGDKAALITIYMPIRRKVVLYISPDDAII